MEQLNGADILAIKSQAAQMENFAISCRGNVDHVLKAYLALQIENVRLRAELEKGAEWQPIDTAPREEVFRDGENRYGKRILVWANGYDEPLRARWWSRSDNDSCNFIADGSYAVFPSHWTPLPAAPDIDAARKGGEG